MYPSFMKTIFTESKVIEVQVSSILFSTEKVLKMIKRLLNSIIDVYLQWEEFYIYLRIQNDKLSAVSRVLEAQSNIWLTA